MKAMVCEMCQGNELIKQDGMYVCQHCGTKYSVEEARKLLVEGTVKIDHSDEVQKLYEVARRARDNDNSENAQKYYDMILVKDPSSWEANFYTVYYQSMGCTIADIQGAAIRLANCQNTVLELIKENVLDPVEQRNAVSEVGARLDIISRMLFGAAKNHYDGIDIQIKYKYIQEYVNRCAAARDMLYYYGDLVIQIFGDIYGDIAAPCWKDAISLHNVLISVYKDKNCHKELILKYAEKIKKYDPSYQVPTINTGGCYVATAIYGSYDCPEVWTLRRFRDYTLAETWYGRIFVRAYYAISPTLVRWFGKTEWFKNICKPTLDRMVVNLNESGVEDTPYCDREW